MQCLKDQLPKEIEQKFIQERFSRLYTKKKEKDKKKGFLSGLFLALPLLFRFTDSNSDVRLTIEYYFKGFFGNTNTTMNPWNNPCNISIGEGETNETTFLNKIMCTIMSKSDIALAQEQIQNSGFWTQIQ